MQKLHLVGFTTDQKGLILSARRGSRSGSYHVTVDDELAEAVEELRAAQAEAEEALAEAEAARPSRVESALPVREIQARLRQGRAVADVAKAAGVEPEWVERFAAPVFAERAQVIARVQGHALRRARLGVSLQPIAEALRRNLAERGVSITPEEFNDAWSARQLADGRWTVRFRYRHRNKDHVLRFDLDEGGGEVVAADRMSSQLGYITPPERPAAKSRPTAAPTPAPPDRPAKRATVTVGFRPDDGRATSPAARERERANEAMRKAAAQHAVEAEKAAARRARERAEQEARRAREAQAAEARRLREEAAAEARKVREAEARARERAAAARKKAAAAKKLADQRAKAKAAKERKKAAAAKKRAAERARAKAAKQRADQARRAEAALRAAERRTAAAAKKKKKKKKSAGAPPGQDRQTGYEGTDQPGCPPAVASLQGRRHEAARHQHGDAQDGREGAGRDEGAGHREGDRAAGRQGDDRATGGDDRAERCRGASASRPGPRDLPALGPSGASGRAARDASDATAGARRSGDPAAPPASRAPRRRGRHRRRSDPRPRTAAAAACPDATAGPGRRHRRHHRGWSRAAGTRWPHGRRQRPGPPAPAGRAPHAPAPRHLSRGRNMVEPSDGAAMRRSGPVTRVTRERPVGVEVLRAAGLAAGLDAVEVASAEPFVDVRRDLEERKAKGLHGGMAFTYRQPARSTDPGRALPDAAALVVGARGYLTSNDADTCPPRAGRVARYAWEDHYALLKEGLGAIAVVLKEHGWRARVLADDNAMVDRADAHRAGIGLWGKNANLLLPGAGSWYVLGGVVTDAPLAPSSTPVDDHCGACRRCLDGCPTGAITAPGVVDARRCLSWLLQAEGPFPLEHRVALGDRIYGCDECQEVCPPNRRSPRRAPSGHERPWVDLAELLDPDDDVVLARAGRWYIPRREVRYVRRNALVVLGNVGDGTDPQVVELLERYLADPDPLLRVHAAWAARRLEREDLLPPLAQETDPTVRAERLAPVP